VADQSHHRPQKAILRTFLALSIFLTILIITAALFLYKTGLFLRADHALYDLHYRIRGPEPVSGDVVLVLMDQASAVELNRVKGSWSRRHMAEALRNLCEAGADVVGLDWVPFAGSADPGEDLDLARAMDECGNTVLAKFVATEGMSEVNPLPVFQEVMIGDGFINMFPDKGDGVLRKVPFFSVKPVEGGSLLSPSFSLEIVRAFLNLDFALDFSQPESFVLGNPSGEHLRLPYPDLRINYAGGEISFERLSFSDVVRNRFPGDSVAGKIVLIGSALATDKDYFKIPFQGLDGPAREFEGTFGRVLTGDYAQNTPGVACHAHAVETMLQGKFIRSAPGGAVAALILVSGVFGLVFHPQRPGVLWGFLIFVCAAAGVFFLSHALFVKRLLWVEIAPILGVLTSQFIAGIGIQRAYSRRSAQLVTGLFGKYVSKGVVDNILKGKIGVQLEGASVEVTVLFSDLRSFTSLSESLTPQETGRLLNTYFDAMIPAVFKHDGTLDKLIGDAIMAFFGAPVGDPDHPVHAARTALDMAAALRVLRRESTVTGVEHLAMGIGLNSGMVTVGNLGSRSFMDYTVIGDTVNLASRLEGLTKHYGVEIIVSGDTAARLNGVFALRELDLVRVKGRDKPVAVFELAGTREDLEPARAEALETFDRALHLYRKREWPEAVDTFRRVLDIVPEDPPSVLYLSRIERLLEEPPPETWDCVTVFTSK